MGKVSVSVAAAASVSVGMVPPDLVWNPCMIV
jgi:hypothetical protein